MTERPGASSSCLLIKSCSFSTQCLFFFFYDDAFRACAPLPQEDVFPLEMHDVGRPCFLMVRSDGSSKKPTWHMDMIVVEGSKYPPAFFQGQVGKIYTWLASVSVSIRAADESNHLIGV